MEMIRCEAVLGSSQVMSYLFISIPTAYELLGKSYKEKMLHDELSGGSEGGTCQPGSPVPL